ncbi:unnamed protein product [Prunus brigantina]
MAGSQPANDQNVVMAQNSERGPSQNVEPLHGDHVIPKTSSVRVCSHSGNSDERDSTIIEILEEIVKGIIKQLEGQDSMDDSR